MRLISALAVATMALVLGTALPGCLAPADNGLKPGINYMRPMNWEMTTHYRVQNIQPQVVGSRHSPWALNPSIDVVGPGTYELWFSGPMEGGNVRNVQLVSSSIQPTSVKQDPKTGLLFYYFDLTPDNLLPSEIDLTLTWRLTTFEEYTHWKDMPREEYDKSSELYKKYTAPEPPITFSKGLKSVSKGCVAEDPKDYVRTALNCFNYLVQNFYYDPDQEVWVEFAGLKALHDAKITWDNKKGVCDEFATVYCAMLRSVGIPARPVAGLVHTHVPIEMIEDEQVRFVVQKVVEKMGPVLNIGGHAWVEFYLPKVGWVPADPTWGTMADVIDSDMSYIGHQRNIRIVDYYFGKVDPYRIDLARNWNYILQPPPKSPNAAPTQDWFVGYVKRDSGVAKTTRGWPNFEKSISYFYRSLEATGTDIDIKIKALGPPKDSEIQDIIAQFKEEGASYLRVPPVRATWPQDTAGYDEIFNKLTNVMNLIEEVTPEMKNAEERQTVMATALAYLFS